MPVLPADVVIPVGSMPSDWHTTEDIQAWIDLGYDSVPAEASTEQADGIATLYTYYRGYRAKADTLLGSPDNVGLEGMSVAQSNGRYDRMVAMADSFLARWEAALAVFIVEPEPEPVLRESRSYTVPLKFRWN
jgi:hypothetical protein